MILGSEKHCNLLRSPDWVSMWQQDGDWTWPRISHQGPNQIYSRQMWQ